MELSQSAVATFQNQKQVAPAFLRNLADRIESGSVEIVNIDFGVSAIPRRVKVTFSDGTEVTWRP